MRSPFHCYTLILAAALAAACADIPADDEAPHTASSAEGVRGNQSTPFDSEENLSDTGRFNEVMQFIARSPGRSGACTATVIAPYAALTAMHCVPDDITSGELRWNDVTLSVTPDVLTNPYLADPHRPAWWNQANAIRNDGRQDDWPAQHDHAVLLVPGLTPEFMREHAIVPAGLDAYGPGSEYRLVGTGASGGFWRDNIENVFEQVTTPGRIDRGLNRDGYLQRENDSMGYGTATPGDSGGPTVGFERFGWTDGRQLFTRPNIVGTAQNPSDLAPLAYVPGMTPNQRLTVRLNNLWIRAAAADADADGLPLGCDSDPVQAGGANLCPAPMGLSYHASRPLGQLECEPGYVVAGIHGRAGSLIDQLGVRCRALSCFSDAGACDEYQTDALGGVGGQAFSFACPAQSAVVRVQGRVQGSVMRDIRVQCANASGVRAGQNALNGFSGVFGNNRGALTTGALNTRTCPVGSALTGLQARGHNQNLVTGVQPVCSAELGRSAVYGGGSGGQGQMLACPADAVAVGVVANETVTNPGASVVGMLGLLCAERSAVAAGQNLGTDDLTVVHSSLYDRNRLAFYPKGQQPLRAFEATRPIDRSPANEQFTDDYRKVQCPAGSALYRLNLRDGAYVDQLNSVGCKTFTAGAQQTSGLAVSLGGWGGSYRAQVCAAQTWIDGVFVRSTNWLDGAAIRCGADAP